MVRERWMKRLEIVLLSLLDVKPVKGPRRGRGLGRAER